VSTTARHFRLFSATGIHYTPSLHICLTHFNIILPIMPRSPKFVQTTDAELPISIYTHDGQYTLKSKAALCSLYRCCKNFGIHTPYKHSTVFNVQFKKPTAQSILNFNPLKTKRRPLYLKTLSVPRSKHFSSRL
jgi:hypothetical protein